MQLPKDVAKHLVSNYGTRALQIAELCKADGEFYCPQVSNKLYGAKRLVSKFPFLEAEVIFACRQEYALTAQDVLARRTRLAFIDSDAAGACCERVVELMGIELGWNKSKQIKEVAEFRKWLGTMNMKDRQTW